MQKVLRDFKRAGIFKTASKNRPLCIRHSALVSNGKIVVLVGVFKKSAHKIGGPALLVVLNQILSFFG